MKDIFKCTHLAILFSFYFSELCTIYKRVVDGNVTKCVYSQSASYSAADE